MNKSLMIAVLWATTALTPARAEAGPVIPFISGLTGGALFTAAGITASLGGAGASAFAIGAAIGGSFLGRAVLSLGASALVAALTPQPKLPKPSESFSTFSQPTSPQERVYGEVKKGGVFGFRSGIIDNKRHWTVTIAAHPTEGPVAHWLDLQEVAIGENGDVLTEPFDGGVVSIRPYTGAAGQTVDPVLLSEFEQVTPAHDFAGHSYAALWNKKVKPENALRTYTQGRETAYLPVWRGWNEIFDPRTQTFGYTNNWALCFAHELSVVWGLPVDWSRVAVEADICDEQVTNRDGQQQNRYTFSNVLPSDQTFSDVLPQWLAVANAMIWQRADGKVDFYAGRWMPPKMTLLPDDFLSFALVDGDHGLSPVTEYVVNYREPGHGYVETPSAAYTLDPEGASNTMSPDIFGIDSHNQALRVAKPLAEAARARFRVSATIGLAHRFVTVDHSFLNAPTVFEVSKLELGQDGVTAQVELVGADESHWSFDAATEEPQPPKYNNDQISDDDPVPEISGFTGAVVEGTGGVAQIAWSWDAPDESLSPVLRVRHDAGEWQELALSSGVVSYTQTGLIDGATYEAQVRARTAGYEVGPWSDLVAVVAVADTSPPAAHSSFGASASGADATLTFGASDSAEYYATRIFRAAYASGYSGPFDIGDAVLARLEYGLPGAVDTWVDQTLAPGVYGYWLVPVNASGVAGPVTGPETIEIF